MNNTTSILRRASTHASTTTTSSRITPSIQTRRSTDSRVLDEVLHDGDEIGPGLSILGQPIRIVNARTPHVPTMRVIRKLGTGSYAVVYLVQEIIPHSDSFLPPLEDSPPPTPAPSGGRYFAVKCLAKHAQDQDAQLLEAEIHQSLPVHDNVVTLWNTLETASYLLLVLDYVPGEDLFYFLEQSRDHEPSDSSATSQPAPALLASLHPEQLLSTQRLRLLASMFSQMCEAVAHCHRNGVFHRDIKPENFMVTDARVYNHNTGQHERRVSVKLTDFGLATRDTESGDMDCGSAPYMSFECHNNITPTYATAPADVWSLGIVLINMLYHANPWLTTAAGQCESFDYFLREPIPFFMNRFPGMTPAVAEFFARSVFCLLGDQSSNPSSMTSPVSAHHPSNTGRRITAEHFGQWSRDLHHHLGPSARRTPALAFQQTPNPPAPRPRSPGETSSRLMAPSVSQPGTRTPSPSYRTRPPVPIHANVIANRGSNTANYGNVDLDSDSDSDSDDGGRMRTTSSSKRRKRALRGNKAQPVQPSSVSTVKSDAALYAASVLAAKSQAVAREASLIKSAKTPPSTYTPLTPAATPIATPVDLASRPATPSRVNTVTAARSTPELRTKKSTKWTDIFKRDSGSDQEVLSAAEWAAMDKQEERISLSSPIQAFDPPAPSATAKNIASLIMGLDSTAPSLSNSVDDTTSWNSNGGRSSSLSSRGRRKDRRGLDRDSQRAVSPGSLMSVSTASTGMSNVVGRGRSAPNDRQARSKSPTQIALAHHLNVLVQPPPADLPPPVPTVPEPYRASVPVPVDAAQAYVPTAQQSSRRSYAPSIASVSTTTTSSSGFTAFSGKNKWRGSNSSASVRSVSTNATSLSSGSWRSNGNRPPLPSNIKPMDGVPWILDELPRQPGFSDRKKGDSRRRAPSTPTPSALGTIAEKPKKSSMKPPRSPIASSFNQARFNGTPYTAKADGENAAGYQPGLMNYVGSFDPSGTSFGVARGGPPMGLQINTDAAIGASGYAGSLPMPMLDVDGVGATMNAVAMGSGKPPKTPTKSRLWPQNWRK